MFLDLQNWELVNFSSVPELTVSFKGMTMSVWQPRPTGDAER